MNLLRAVFAFTIFCVLAVASNAQSKVQLIHNSASFGADSVDIWLRIPSSPTQPQKIRENFAFRNATGFLDVPSGIAVQVGVAPKTSTQFRDTLVTFTFTFEVGKNYVAIANGVIPTDGGTYAANPDAKSITFNAFALPGELTAPSGTVRLNVFHGATDAPGVNVTARGQSTPLISNLQYGSSTGYTPLPAAKYTLDISASAKPSDVLLSYVADISALGGNAAVVFASGFFDPTKNTRNSVQGAGFGLYVALPSGEVVKLPAEVKSDIDARILIVHNCADPAAKQVDIYAGTTKIADNLPFRYSTRWLDVPPGVEIPVSVNLPTSTSSTDGVVKTFTTPKLEAGKEYVVMAHGTGVVSLNGFDQTVNQNIGFTITPIAITANTTTNSLDIYAFHGATDAPAVDIRVEGSAQPLVSNFRYSQNGKVTVPSANANALLKVVPAGATTPVVREYILPLQGSGGMRALVYASGFLEPSKNSNGANFELYISNLDNTDTVPGTQFILTKRLPGKEYSVDTVDQSSVQIIHNCADPVANKVDLYVDGQLVKKDFTYKTALPFVKLDPGIVHYVSLNLPGSTSTIDKVVDEYEVELPKKAVVYAIASGVVDNTGFTPVSGRDISLNILAATAREASTNPQTVQASAFHGCVDAPAVDIYLEGKKVNALSNLNYGNSTPFADLQPGTYTIGVAPTGQAQIASFRVTLTESTRGAAGLIVATGFLTGTGSKANSPFGLFVVLPDGTTVPLPSVPVSVEETVELRDNALTPNPVSSSANLTYTMKQNSTVTISVVDALGNEVIRLNEGVRTEGEYTLPLPVAQLANGAYTARIITGNGATAVRFVVSR
jgi:hypothetical protein